MSSQTQVANYLESLSPAQLVADKKVTEKFVTLYNAIHGGAVGESIYQKEQFNFNKLIQETPALQECTKMSLYGCFLDVAVNGLSLDNTSKPLAYMVSRNAKTKTANGQEAWEKRASIIVSPYGELLMRMRAGHIKKADNPIIVYEGDTIKVGLNAQGHRVVKEYDAQIPRKQGAKIIGGFLRIERHDGAFECSWVDIAEIERLKGFSNKQNRGTAAESKANALYTSNNGQIDSGFFEAKIIKHAFRSYPKIRIGDFTGLQTEAEEPETAINYNLAETPQTNNTNQTIEEAKQVDDDFNQPTPTQQQNSVIIDDETF